MTFIPHTPADIQAMLKSIGVSEWQGIFDEIPQNIPRAELDQLPEGMNEQELLSHANNMAKRNPSLCCFTGAGCYDHHIPSAIWDIATRGEFLTSYTPYQAEVSQGTLQVLYEFQSMIAELFALDVANASLYDGATALAESILMAKRIQKQLAGTQVLIPHMLHPHYKQVLQTILNQQQIGLIEMPFDAEKGITNTMQLHEIAIENIFAVCIVQPNFMGILEDVHHIADWAKQNKLISIACVNPVSLGVLTPPGCWGTEGADIACAEGQPFGVPMSSGGPFLGLISCKKEYARQIPGRMVGKTIDSEQNTGFVLTLQAREQHIRRGKATSNICTNQGLNVVAATIYMSLMGPQGLKSLAQTCYQNTHYIAEELCKIPGVSLVFPTPYFHEAVIHFDEPFQKLLAQFDKANILPGLLLETYFPEMKNCLLICATEKRSPEEIAQYLQCVKETLLENRPQSHECQLGV